MTATQVFITRLFEITSFKYQKMEKKRQEKMLSLAKHSRTQENISLRAFKKTYSSPFMSVAATENPKYAAIWITRGKRNGYISSN